MHLRRGLYLCALLAWLAVSARAGDVAVARQNLAADYAEQLAQLAAWCDGQSLTDEAAQTRAWRPTPEPLTIALYVTTPAQPWPPSVASTESAQEWGRRFAALRTDHAKATYSLAQQAARDGDVAAACQLVYGTLREDPDHADARRLLGYERDGDCWRTSYEVDKAKAGQVWHDRFGWLPREHVARYEAGERFYTGRWMPADEEARLRGANIDRAPLVMTEHFGIRSGADLEAAVRWSIAFERLYQAWQQLFVGYYLPADKVAAAFAGDGTLEPPGVKKFEVVLFADREAYVASLIKRQPRVEITVGYYDYDQRKSYLYAESEPRYVLHELIHQFFCQARPTVRRVGQESNFWVVEGVACYFESLVEHDGYVTLGGANGGRMGSARGALLSDKYFMPLGEFCAEGRLAFQRDPKIAWQYAQAAGLTHFLIHADDARYRPALVNLLTAVFTAKDQPQTLSVLTDKSFDELGIEYREFIELDASANP